EEPIPLRLERPVVDGLGLGHFAPRPPRALALQLQALALLGVLGAADLLGRGDPDLDIVKARALGLVAASEIDHYSSTSSVVPSVTFNPSAWSSFTSTLKDSGIPGFGRFCPFTIASYTRLRPFTSSDLTVRISCSVCAAPYSAAVAGRPVASSTSAGLSLARTFSISFAPAFSPAFSAADRLLASAASSFAACTSCSIRYCASSRSASSFPASLRKSSIWR